MTRTSGKEVSRDTGEYCTRTFFPSFFLLFFFRFLFTSLLDERSRARDDGARLNRVIIPSSVNRICRACVERSSREFTTFVNIVSGIRVWTRDTLTREATLPVSFPEISHEAPNCHLVRWKMNAQHAMLGSRRTFKTRPFRNLLYEQ